MILSNPFHIVGGRPLSAAPTSPKRPPPVSDRLPMAAAYRSPVETRVSLVLAVAAQAASASQRLLLELVAETAKYAFPKRFESRNLEEALMAVPDLETVKFKVLARRDEYEIRQVEPYFIAETTIPGNSGFDFAGASRSFNVLAAYLFGDNTASEKMEMTTPVYTRYSQLEGVRMEMTTPVITKRVSYSFVFNNTIFDIPIAIIIVQGMYRQCVTYDPIFYLRQSELNEKWQMSFVMPSKYSANLPVPKDSSVRIREVPEKIIAVAAFSGFVSDEEVKRRETSLQDALKRDFEFKVKEGASVEIAQYNPPFTLPFMRRNEIALEIELRKS